MPRVNALTNLQHFYNSASEVRARFTVGCFQRDLAHQVTTVYFSSKPSRCMEFLNRDLPESPWNRYVEEAHAEFRLVREVYSDLEHKCACGCCRLKNLFYLENQINGNVILVGSTCITHFEERYMAYFRHNRIEPVPFSLIVRAQEPVYVQETVREPVELKSYREILSYLTLALVVLIGVYVAAFISVPGMIDDTYGYMQHRNEVKTELAKVSFSVTFSSLLCIHIVRLYMYRLVERKVVSSMKRFLSFLRRSLLTILALALFPAIALAIRIYYF